MEAILKVQEEYEANCKQDYKVGIFSMHQDMTKSVERFSMDDIKALGIPLFLSDHLATSILELQSPNLISGPSGAGLRIEQSQTVPDFAKKEKGEEGAGMEVVSSAFKTAAVDLAPPSVTVVNNMFDDDITDNTLQKSSTMETPSKRKRNDTTTKEDNKKGKEKDSKGKEISSTQKVQSPPLNASVKKDETGGAGASGWMSKDKGPELGGEELSPEAKRGRGIKPSPKSDVINVKGTEIVTSTSGTLDVKAVNDGEGYGDDSISSPSSVRQLLKEAIVDADGWITNAIAVPRTYDEYEDKEHDHGNENDGMNHPRAVTIETDMVIKSTAAPSSSSLTPKQTGISAAKGKVGATAYEDSCRDVKKFKKNFVRMIPSSGLRFVFPLYIYLN